jgi:predicted glycoside hydrolase/deacetylase ChbG (UPF0249 family)
MAKGGDMILTGQPLVLCADDFALAPGVDEAIVRLAEAGRLSAISCMAVMADWPHAARRLEVLQDRCDIGLHLTLTDQPPLGPMPQLAPGGMLPALSKLFAAAFAGRLTRGEAAAEVKAEVVRQWDAFVQARGRLPDFVDGHQHVHLLPGIRSAVLDQVIRCPVGERPWLRSCWESPARVLARRIASGKALLLATLSLPLRRAALAGRLATNTSFRGVHGFAANADYAAMFRQFLKGRSRRPLIMCHPGLVDDRLRAVDTVVEPRQDEYAYFSSHRFRDDLAEAGLHVARFREFASG